MARSRINLECVLLETVQIYDHTVVFAEVIHMRIPDELIDGDRVVLEVYLVA